MVGLREDRLQRHGLRDQGGFQVRQVVCLDAPRGALDRADHAHVVHHAFEVIAVRLHQAAGVGSAGTLMVTASVRR